MSSQFAPKTRQHSFQKDRLQNTTSAPLLDIRSTDLVGIFLPLYVQFRHSDQDFENSQIYKPSGCFRIVRSLQSLTDLRYSPMETPRCPFASSRFFRIRLSRKSTPYPVPYKSHIFKFLLLNLIHLFGSNPKNTIWTFAKKFIQQHKNSWRLW